MVSWCWGQEFTLMTLSCWASVTSLHDLGLTHGQVFLPEITVLGPAWRSESVPRSGQVQPIGLRTSSVVRRLSISAGQTCIMVVATSDLV